MERALLNFERESGEALALVPFECSEGPRFGCGHRTLELEGQIVNLTVTLPSTVAYTKRTRAITASALAPSQHAIDMRTSCFASYGSASKPMPELALVTIATLPTCDGMSSALQLSDASPSAARVYQRRSRYGNQDQTETIAALQQNIAALTLINRREKAQAEALAARMGELESERDSLKEMCAEERAKSEKITALRRQRQHDGYDDEGLPYTGHSAAAAATSAALQQQTQLEVSYQRKILSIESRCRDLIDNNKRLLAKIKKLEETEVDAQQQITALQRENERAGTQVDGLTSTVASQSALIAGLRKTVNDANREKQMTTDLARKLTRCQTELESTKLREKLLRDATDKASAAAALEKQTLMDKVVDLQRRVQQSDQAGGHVQALETQISLQRRENASLATLVSSWTDKCRQAEERMHQQEQMTNRLLQENRSLDETVAQLRAALSAKEDERVEMEGVRSSKIRELQLQLEATIQAQDEAVSALGAAKDKEIGSLMDAVVQLQGDLDGRDKAIAELQNEVSRFEGEIQSLKQLSQDETVQALQLARQKAASQEALVLVSEEKRALEDTLQTLEARLAAEQSQLQREKDKKAELSDRLDASMRVIQQLHEENASLTDKLNAAEAQAENLREELAAVPVREEAAVTPAPMVVEVAEVPAPMTMEIAEVPAPATEEALSAEEKARLEMAIAQLKDEYEIVAQQKRELDKEFLKLVTKKYKTESFQNQVQLLQNENSALSSRLEQLFQDLSKERQMVGTLSQELRELRQRAVDPELVGKLRSTQEALERTVNALVEAEAASESSFTCLQCMQPFRDPATLVPCGHTYCAGCLSGMGDAREPSTIVCRQCAKGKPHETDGVFPNQALADLTARFLFRQQTLATMASMCLSLRNNFADRSSVA